MLCMSYTLNSIRAALCPEVCISLTLGSISAPCRRFVPIAGAGSLVCSSSAVGATPVKAGQQPSGPDW